MPLWLRVSGVANYRTCHKVASNTAIACTIFFARSGFCLAKATLNRPPTPVLGEHRQLCDLAKPTPVGSLDYLTYAVRDHLFLLSRIRTPKRSADLILILADCVGAGKGSKFLLPHRP